MKIITGPRLRPPARPAALLLACILLGGFVTIPVAAQQPQATAPDDTSNDSAVAAILATKPTAPAECVRAAKILAELDRPDLAKQYLKKVLDADLDHDELVALGRQVGTTLFTEMAGRESLLPESKKLADARAGSHPLRDRKRRPHQRAYSATSGPFGRGTLAGAGRFAGGPRGGHRAAYRRIGRQGPRRGTCQRSGGAGRNRPARDRAADGRRRSGRSGVGRSSHRGPWLAGRPENGIIFVGALSDGRQPACRANCGRRGPQTPDRRRADAARGHRRVDRCRPGISRTKSTGRRRDGRDGDRLALERVEANLRTADHFGDRTPRDRWRPVGRGTPIRWPRTNGRFACCT